MRDFVMLRILHMEVSQRHDKLIFEDSRKFNL